MRKNEPVDDASRRMAMGALGGSPYLLRKAITSYLPVAEFKRLPGTEDWLANEYEAGQTFDQYKVYANRVERGRNKVYVKPIGEDLDMGMVKSIRKLTTAYYPGLVFPMLKSIPLSNLSVESRTGPFGPQYPVSPILYQLQKHSPLDRYGVFGLTMADLYTDESSNFVFGVSNVINKTAVVSFVRYVESETPENSVFTRACKVILHEMGHMVGLLHCIYYECLMNGSNSITELDQNSFRLCPICLKKLHYCFEFDIIQWYRNLSSVFMEIGMREESEWHQNRAESIQNSLPGRKK